MYAFALNITLKEWKWIVNFFSITAKFRMLLKNFSINSQIRRLNLIPHNTGFKNIYLRCRFFGTSIDTVSGSCADGNVFS